MYKKVINMTLDSKSIDKAIKEINSFKADLQKKLDTYRKRISEEIAEQGKVNFASAIMDDVINGSPRTPSVEVYFTDNGGISVVVADGEDAVWCEFGAGIYHNGSAGSSPHEWGGKLGYTIGGYGKGKGKQEVWGFYLDPNAKTGLVLTRGTPASMPLYNAVQDVTRRAISIAEEVFR